jgi:5,10-methylenetetrahydromethanopterin reductase
VDISCALATSFDTPDHVVEAEAIGYRRAWLYDSPALYPDVWVSLARCAERTRRIGLGPAVLVPSLRHVMTNAAAVATLEHLAPGRVAVALGTGFTGRYVLGQPPLRWAETAAYVRALRDLLAGRQVEWEGALIQMIHPEGFGPARPIEVPVLVSAMGPKGLALAAELADGVFSVGSGQAGFAWSAVLVFGTVVDEGEALSSPRVEEAAGPGAVVMYHALYESGGVAGLPGGEEWLAALESFPERERHLRVHERHLVGLNDWDRPLLDAELISGLTLTGSASEVRARLDAMASHGVTEVAYQPCGPDIVGELRRFAAAAGL